MKKTSLLIGVFALASLDVYKRQLQLRVFQEARELPPLRKRVVRRLSQRARRQGGVASCLDFPADDLHQWLCSLQAQHVACGVIEFLRARQSVDAEDVYKRQTKCSSRKRRTQGPSSVRSFMLSPCA